MAGLPYKTLIELGYVVLGLIAATGIAWLSAWSYPLARDDIWLTAYVAIAATFVMAVRPLRRAWTMDRRRMNG